MLDKNDISKVRGIVSAKDIIKELGITNAQFTKMVRNEEVYNGCILVPVIRESGRELPTSESEELYQLVCESDSGFRYYITSHIRVVSVSPFDGVEKEIHIRKTSETRYAAQIVDGKRKKHISVLGEAYKAFVGEIKDKHIVVCDGDLKIENLKLVDLSEVNRLKNSKKVKVGDKIYNSVIECANKNFISVPYMYQMLEGIKPNLIGVELV
jgi:hypothetical protein